MRREQIAGVDPDTEAARIEIAAIEGDKTNLQSTIDEMASNKKRMEADFEVAKKKIDDELIQKRKETDEEKLRLSATNDTLRRSNSELEVSNFSLNATARNLADLEGVLKSSVTKLTAAKEQLEIDIKNAKESFSDLDKKISDKATEHFNLSAKYVLLSKDVSELEAKKIETGTAHVNLQADVAMARSSLKGLTDAKKTTEDAHAGVKTELEDARKLLSNVNDEVFRAQRELATYREQKRQEEADMATKAGNLSRLEVAVDAKMLLFKEAKAHFTTEELLRMGIKD